MTRVEEVMTAPVVVLRENLTLFEATTALAEKGISGAPVVNDKGDLVGMLSESDILEFAISKEGGGLEAQTLSFVALPYEKIVRDAELCGRYQKVGQAKVSEVMNDEIVTIDHDEDIQKALETMVRFEVKRLPVVDSGKLVGIVSRQDVLVHYCQELGDKESPICAAVTR